MLLVVVSRETLYEDVAQEALLAQLRDIHPTLSLQAYPVKSSGAVTARAGLPLPSSPSTIHNERDTDNTRSSLLERNIITFHSTAKNTRVPLLCVHKNPDTTMARAKRGPLYLLALFNCLFCVCVLLIQHIADIEEITLETVEGICHFGTHVA